MPQANEDYCDLVFRVTLLLLLIYGASSWHLSVLLRILCAAMLAVPSLLRKWQLWLIAVAIEIFFNLSMWYSIDNHKYLISYWTLACCLATANDERKVIVLRKNAEWLLAGCFTFAFFWKVYGAQFHNGAFLQYVFLTDPRISVPISILSGISLEQLESNRMLFGLLTSLPGEGRAAQLDSNSSIRILALVCSYWTLLIEGLVAGSWLCAGWKRKSSFRHFALLTFVFSTYFILPVPGFATILCLLGLAASGPSDRTIQMVYLISLLAVQLVLVPWQNYIAPLTTVAN